MKKNSLPQLEIGRSVANARKFREKSPKVLSFKEYEAIKIILKYWKPAKVAKELSRGKNTILRINKSKSYEGYKSIVADQNRVKHDPHTHTAHGQEHVINAMADNQNEAEQEYLYYLRSSMGYMSRAEERETELLSCINGMFYMVLAIALTLLVILFMIG